MLPFISAQTLFRGWSRAVTKRPSNSGPSIHRCNTHVARVHEVNCTHVSAYWATAASGAQARIRDQKILFGEGSPLYNIHLAHRYGFASRRLSHATKPLESIVIYAVVGACHLTTPAISALAALDLAHVLGGAVSRGSAPLSCTSEL